MKTRMQGGIKHFAIRLYISGPFYASGMKYNLVIEMMKLPSNQKICEAPYKFPAIGKVQPSEHSIYYKPSSIA